MKRWMIWMVLCALFSGLAGAADAEELTYYFHIEGTVAGQEYALLAVSGDPASLDLGQDPTIYYADQKTAQGASLDFTVVRPAAFETAAAFVISETGAVVMRFVLNRSGEASALPAGLTVLEDESFADCGMTHVIVPEGCLSIGAGAFANQRQPLILELPESLTSIGDGALQNCPHALIIAPAGSYAIHWARENNVVYACAAN